MSEFKGELAQKAPALEDIPTECRRCGKVFPDKDMVWINAKPGEKWFVCEHCASIIGWCNHNIEIITGIFDRAKEGHRWAPVRTPCSGR